MSSDSEHTPEPWFPESFAGYNKTHSRYGRPFISDADIRRIVACVNACAGIPTETLELLDPGDLTFEGDLR